MMWQLLATFILPLVSMGMQAPLQSPRHIVFGTTTTSTPSFSLEVAPALTNGPRRVITDSLGISVTASSTIALDAASGAVVFEKNADATRTLASITKLMTLQTIIDTLPADSTVLTIEQGDYERVGHNTFNVGDTATVHDAMASAIIASDNTAVRALVRVAGFTPATAVTAMNERAQSLGLVRTSFTEVTGLADSNVATAREVAVFAQKAFELPRIARFAGLRSYQFTAPDGTSYSLKNTNKLIGGIIHIVAGKTGFVDEAGYNLVSLVDLNGHRVLIVSLGSGTTLDRFQDVKAVATWVFENYTWP